MFLQFTGINFYAHEKAVKSTHNFKHKRLEKRCNHALSEPFTLIQLSKMGLYYISNKKQGQCIKKTATSAFNAGKRPFYFPLFFKLLQATQLLFFYAAFTAHTLSLIVLIAASPAAFLFFYAAFGGLLFPLLFVFINHP